MKRYDNLFDKINNYSNYRTAFTNATKGKSHYSEVRILSMKKRTYLHKLVNSVRNGTYQVSEYTNFQLWSGGKWRDISKLPMKDRIVQHAIMNYLEPIFRECFIQDTFASIKSRGIHMALQRVKQELKEHPEYKYQLSMDIRKCYPSLDKNILKEKLKKKFKDAKLLKLLFLIIDSYNVDSNNGVPIGNYTSQYFNNFYFTDLDHKLKENLRVKAYFRYCDNMKVLAETKEELHKILNFVKEEVKKLNVELKPDYQISSIDDRGVDFVGYIIKSDYINIRKQTKKNFIRKVSKMNFLNLSKKDINVLGSYWGILKYADCRNLWLKYTKVKSFKDLKIAVHEREFVPFILDKEIIVKNSFIYYKKKEKRLMLEIDYTDDKGELHENVQVSTSGELLLEAGSQFNKKDYPFKTVITETEKGYYMFN